MHETGIGAGGGRSTTATIAADIAAMVPSAAPLPANLAAEQEVDLREEVPVKWTIAAAQKAVSHPDTRTQTLRAWIVREFESAPPCWGFPEGVRES